MSQNSVTLFEIYFVSSVAHVTAVYLLIRVMMGLWTTIEVNPYWMSKKITVLKYVVIYSKATVEQTRFIFDVINIAAASEVRGYRVDT